MRTSKSRSRGKRPNNNRYTGNIINRVFDSSGPEGKVRGTPQQIIEKYSQLHRDSQLSNDRVAAENFQQHAEHYARMLTQAQREQDELRETAERSSHFNNKDQADGSPSRDKVTNNSSQDLNEVKPNEKNGARASDQNKDHNLKKKSTKPALGAIKKGPDVSVVSNEQDKLNDEAVEDTSENTLVN
jgi:hypothetical protein